MANEELKLGCAGLALLAGITISTWDNSDKIKKLDRKIDSFVEKLQPQVKTENVLGNSEPETFCEINGQRFYLKIDNKPVEGYFR